MLDGTLGEPGWTEAGSPLGANKEGERYGDEKESR
jgi:hypothetical protein